MREATFIKNNVKKWEEFEEILKANKAVAPDLLASLFIQVTDDLSFSRTQYPKSKTTQYLNNLASSIYVEIYKNKKEDKARFIKFWKYEVPELLSTAQHYLLYAFLIFVVSIVIGCFSQSKDHGFVRLILGDSYVNMTLRNIEKGEPLAVYGGTEETDMFISITMNNVRVSFYVFAAGILFSIGSGLLLFYNGVMVGVFFTFLQQQGYLNEALSVVMLHGTLELSAIAIAGGAGLMMGNHLLFPGTYPRIEALKIGAKQGLKVVMGLVPVFILAGFIESFITRHTDMPLAIKLGIILLSSAFILYYYIIYPIQIKHGLHRNHSVS